MGVAVFGISFNIQNEHMLFLLVIKSDGGGIEAFHILKVIKD